MGLSRSPRPQPEVRSKLSSSSASSPRGEIEEEEVVVDDEISASVKRERLAKEGEEGEEDDHVRDGFSAPWRISGSENNNKRLKRPPPPLILVPRGKKSKCDYE